MANPSYEKDWKTFLQCKECWEFKEINKENWYYHKLWYLWVSWRCRECVLKWRSSEREHIMSRKRDMDRYHNNPKRKEYIHQLARDRIKRHEENWENWNSLHERTVRLISKLQNRPNKCPICWRESSRIIAHHPKLENWWEVVFCCSICHSWIHEWKIGEYAVVNLKEEEEKWYKEKNNHAEELCRKLRQMTLPPAWMDQSEEGIKKWRSL